MEQSEKKGLVSLHLAVLLFGLSGLFAKINLPTVIIVLGRVCFSSISLWCFLKLTKQKILLNQKSDYLWMIGAGVILAVHWVTFMQSIQVSTVAIGTIVFSTFPLFVTFLEPYLFHEKLKISNVICAVIMLVGVIIMVPEFELGNTMTQGIAFGLVGAFTYAVLGLMNRRFTGTYPAAVVSFYEQGTAFWVLLPTLFVIKPQITVGNLGLIFILGVVFTALSHTLFINSLRSVKVSTAGIVSGLESVYSIISAFLILGEVPSVKEVIGGAIILGTVFYSTIKSQNK